MDNYKLNIKMAEEVIPLLLFELINNNVITEEQADEVFNTVFEETEENLKDAEIKECQS